MVYPLYHFAPQALARAGLVPKRVLIRGE